MQIASNAGQDQSEGIAEEVASYVDGKVPGMRTLIRENLC